MRPTVWRRRLRELAISGVCVIEKSRMRLLAVSQLAGQRSGTWRQMSSRGQGEGASFNRSTCTLISFRKGNVAKQHANNLCVTKQKHSPKPAASQAPRCEQPEQPRSLQLLGGRTAPRGVVKSCGVLSRGRVGQ